ncbi:MAG: hypothetical protein ABW022_08630 [Actinoplanes sp.]
MIDDEFRAQWEAAVARHYKFGTALVEELDRAGLLVTSQRRDQVEQAVLNDLLERLEARGAVTMMRVAHGRVQGAPAEMFAAVSAWMGDFVRSRRTSS